MKLNLISVTVASFFYATAAQAVSLSPAGYTQSFDSMGTGTAAPTDWRIFNGEAGSGNSTWVGSIAANGTSGSVASMVLSAASLTETTAPAANANNGYNAAVSATTVTDRILGTAPTTISGSALELSLTNDTGFSFNAVNLSYDTVRFTAVATANQLPGYQVFFSLGGNSWTNAVAFNPTLANVPNSAGVSPFAGVLSLGASVGLGQTLLLRWVDDNAQQTSPDQIIGLNNLSVSAVPEPATMPLLLAGLAVVGWMSMRQSGRRG